MTDDKILKERIDETHKHGLALKAEIEKLEKEKRFGWQARVAVKKTTLKGLEELNKRRWSELHANEKAQLEKEHPKPKPNPPKPERFAMYDAVTLSAIPHDPPATMGYVDGYANYEQMVRDFPKAKHFSVTTAGNNANVLDIEPKTVAPEFAPTWVRRQHARGVKRPCVYAPLSWMWNIERILADSGIKRDEYLVFTAHWTGVPHIEPGSDATQWLGEHHGYDESLCEPHFEF